MSWGLMNQGDISLHRLNKWEDGAAHFDYTQQYAKAHHGRAPINKLWTIIYMKKKIDHLGSQNQIGLDWVRKTTTYVKVNISWRQI